MFEGDGRPLSGSVSGAADAVAAREAEQGLASTEWPHEGGLRVRMVVHTGEPLTTAVPGVRWSAIRAGPNSVYPRSVRGVA